MSVLICVDTKNEEDRSMILRPSYLNNSKVLSVCLVEYLLEQLIFPSCEYKDRQGILCSWATTGITFLQAAKPQ